MSEDGSTSRAGNQSASEEEHRLILAAKSGDADALEQLLAGYHDRLRRATQRRIERRYRSSMDADDVLQVTYIEAFMYIEGFVPNGPGSFYGWLERAAINNLLDAKRRLDAAKRPSPHRRVSAGESDDSFVALWRQLSDGGRSPSRAVAASEAKRLLETALGALPGDYEHVVRGYDLGGLSAAQLAQQMGRSVGAIHMLRARAHDRLARLLGGSTRFFFE